MDPTAHSSLSPAPLARPRDYAKSDGGSTAPTDPMPEFFRPPSPGLGSIHSRQTHNALASHNAREVLRSRKFIWGVGVCSTLLLLIGLLIFFLFPRVPVVSPQQATATLNGAPSPASFSATFSIPLVVDNSASYAPWGIKDLSVIVYNTAVNAPMSSVATKGITTIPARTTKSLLLTLVINSAAANGNAVAILACAQGILAGTGCSIKIVLTGIPSYLGYNFPPRTWAVDKTIA